MPKISVVINTFNEEENIKRAIESVRWADEILVCDMRSSDNTAVIAKKMGAKVIFHKKVDFVEPTRNFSILKTSGDWVLVMDPDEEIPESLSAKISDICKDPGIITHVEIARKNLIFGHWMKASMWWPDYKPRFFKKGCVFWSDKIHRPPQITGQGLTLPADERFAYIHHHYTSVSQFIERMNRYTTIQAKELREEGYKFNYKDLISKPLGEFLGRFFANKGFEDGLYGLVLSFLQAFSHLTMYIKIWELEKFPKAELKFSDIRGSTEQGGKELRYWFKYGDLSGNKFKRLMQKIKNRIS